MYSVFKPAMHRLRSGRRGILFSNRLCSCPETYSVFTPVMHRLKSGRRGIPFSKRLEERPEKAFRFQTGHAPPEERPDRYSRFQTRYAPDEEWPGMCIPFSDLLSTACGVSGSFFFSNRLRTARKTAREPFCFGTGFARPWERPERYSVFKPATHRLKTGRTGIPFSNRPRTA